MLQRFSSILQSCFEHHISSNCCGPHYCCCISCADHSSTFRAISLPDASCLSFSPAFRIFEFDCQLLWYLLIVPSLFTWYFGMFILCLPCILNSSRCCQYLYLFTVFSTYVVSKLLLISSDGVWLLIVVLIVVQF